MGGTDSNHGYEVMGRDNTSSLFFTMIGRLKFPGY